MEGEENGSMRKRMRQSVEDERMVEDETVVEIVGEDAETGVPLSEQMQADITHILEKIDRFTQLVSELMESGKTLLQELSNDFEERLITLHKEQMEIWQEEIKKLRSLDASNEDINATLQNARLLLHHVQSDS